MHGRTMLGNLSFIPFPVRLFQVREWLRARSKPVPTLFQACSKLFQACSKHVPSLFQVFEWFQARSKPAPSKLFQACSMAVPSLFQVFKWFRALSKHVPSLFQACSRPVPSCSKLVPSVFQARSKFLNGSGPVPSLFQACSKPVPSLFQACSEPVPNRSKPVPKRVSTPPGLSQAWAKALARPSGMRASEVGRSPSLPFLLSYVYKTFDEPLQRPLLVGCAAQSSSCNSATFLSAALSCILCSKQIPLM